MRAAIGMARVPELRNLRALDLTRCNLMSRSLLTVPSCPRLETLVLRQCRRVSEPRLII